MSATKNQWYVWVVLCGEDHGFGACYDGLWGRERRVYRTRSEACAHRDALINAGCWVDDETGEEEIPEFYVERMTILQALEYGGEIERETRELMPPSGTRVPLRVLRDTAAAWGVAADAHTRTSASLQGASSATHAHALIAGHLEHKAKALLALGRNAVLT